MAGPIHSKAAGTSDADLQLRQIAENATQTNLVMVLRERFTDASKQNPSDNARDSDVAQDRFDKCCF